MLQLKEKHLGIIQLVYFKRKVSVLLSVFNGLRGSE